MRNEAWSVISTFWTRIEDRNTGTGSPCYEMVGITDRNSQICGPQLLMIGA
jgi:hypothetical protein